MIMVSKDTNEQTKTTNYQRSNYVDDSAKITSDPFFVVQHAFNVRVAVNHIATNQHNLPLII